MRKAGLFFVGAAAFIVAMSACSGDLPDITSESEEGGFCDLVFRVQGRVQHPDGTQSIRAYGRHEGRRVGLEVALGSAWKQVSLDSSLPPAFQGTVEFRSIGPDSDVLLSVMDKLYETKLGPASMSSATIFNAITLEGDPRDPARGIVKIKLFFEPGDEEGYAELYANIDLQAGRVYVNEKDPDYRTPIIKALAASRDGG